jgi:hypothetical protein
LVRALFWFRLWSAALIVAIVRYRLPAQIDYEACRAHFLKIAPGFKEAPGLHTKRFIWSETGVAGGVYEWASREDAERFYSGPWRDGIVERYGMAPEIEYFEVFALTDNRLGTVTEFPGLRAP